MAPIVLITRLAALAEAVAELRESQQHAAQAAAAERLYAATRPAPAPQQRSAPRASTAAQLAGLSFPQPARPAPQPAAPGQPGPDQGGPPPARRPPPPRPRGPSR
jgi:soluble lytic murein transglycosylase-like protein